MERKNEEVIENKEKNSRKSQEMETELGDNYGITMRENISLGVKVVCPGTLKWRAHW